jgi:hypothetical protein
MKDSLFREKIAPPGEQAPPGGGSANGMGEQGPPGWGLSGERKHVESSGTGPGSSTWGLRLAHDDGLVVQVEPGTSTCTCWLLFHIEIHKIYNWLDNSCGTVHLWITLLRYGCPEFGGYGRSTMLSVP